MRISERLDMILVRNVFSLFFFFEIIEIAVSAIDYIYK